MSDTVKIIIEIDKEDIEVIRKTSFIEDEKTMFKQSLSDRQGTMMLFRLMDSVKNGTPLDDVKAEIVALPKTYPFINHIDSYVKEDDVLQILDNIGKAESEGT